MADNAVLRMNKVIDKLVEYKPPTIYVPTLKEFLAEMEKQDPELQEIFSRLLGNPNKANKSLMN